MPLGGYRGAECVGTQAFYYYLSKFITHCRSFWTACIVTTQLSRIYPANIGATCIGLQCKIDEKRRRDTTPHIVTKFQLL